MTWQTAAPGSTTYFGPSRFAGESWYGGHYGSSNLNSWQTFEGSGMQFLILHLQHAVWTAELEWAQDVIAAHPGYRVIVSTHDYLNVDGTRDTNGDRIWDNLVRDNCSIFLVLSGHNQPSGSQRGHQLLRRDGAADPAELPRGWKRRQRLPALLRVPPGVGSGGRLHLFTDRARLPHRGRPVQLLLRDGGRRRVRPDRHHADGGLRGHGECDLERDRRRRLRVVSPPSATFR